MLRVAPRAGTAAEYVARDRGKGGRDGGREGKEGRRDDVSLLAEGARSGQSLEGFFSPPIFYSLPSLSTGTSFLPFPLLPAILLLLLPPLPIPPLRLLPPTIMTASMPAPSPFPWPPARPLSFPWMGERGAQTPLTILPTSRKRPGSFGRGIAWRNGRGKEGRRRRRRRRRVSVSGRRRLRHEGATGELRKKDNMTR